MQTDVIGTALILIILNQLYVTNSTVIVFPNDRHLTSQNFCTDQQGQITLWILPWMSWEKVSEEEKHNRYLFAVVVTHHWAVWWCPWGAGPSHSSSASPDVRPAAGSAGRGEEGLQRSPALYQNCKGEKENSRPICGKLNRKSGSSTIKHISQLVLLN